MENLISIPSQLETFSDEIFFEIFDRLSPTGLYQTFYGLNNRLNKILNDSRMRFRDNISSLNSKELRFYIKIFFLKLSIVLFHLHLEHMILMRFDKNTNLQIFLFLYYFSINRSVVFCIHILLI